MAESSQLNLTGYGPRNRWENLMFNGDADRYEQWEVKMLAYMKLKKLKKIILPAVDENEAVDDDKNDEAFSELVQFLDDTSLGLVIRDAKDDGRKALSILREHYAGSGKPRIISLYTVLTSLQKSNQETITDYIIRAETAATSLKNAKEIISDSLLIAMVMKGLPREYQPFVVVTTQTNKELSFSEFKISLKSFEETISSQGNHNTVMNMKFESKQNQNKKISCYTCGNEGHKSVHCRNKKQLWCFNCKSNSHSTKACRKNKRQPNDKVKHNKHEPDEENTFSFCIKDSNFNCEL